MKGPGKVTPNGDTSIFIELPQWSIGNGIRRFNSKGDMFIADYTNHNVLKSLLADKRLSVRARAMNQPNDIAIDSKDRIMPVIQFGKQVPVKSGGSIPIAKSPSWKDMGTPPAWRRCKPWWKALVCQWIRPAQCSLGPMIYRIVVLWAIKAADSISWFWHGWYALWCRRQSLHHQAWKGTIVKLSPKVKEYWKRFHSQAKVQQYLLWRTDGRRVYITLQDNGNIETFLVGTPEW